MKFNISQNLKFFSCIMLFVLSISSISSSSKKASFTKREIRIEANPLEKLNENSIGKKINFQKNKFNKFNKNKNTNSFLEIRNKIKHDETKSQETYEKEVSNENFKMDIQERVSHPEKKINQKNDKGNINKLKKFKFNIY